MNEQQIKSTVEIALLVAIMVGTQVFPRLTALVAGLWLAHKVYDSIKQWRL